MPSFVGILLPLLTGTILSAPYKYHDYTGLTDEIHSLAAAYPGLASAYSANERYNLGYPKEYLMSSKCKNPASAGNIHAGCHSWVLHITDHASLPSAPHRPEVFLSGEIHGDERVGPAATMAAASLIVRASACVGKEHMCQR